MAEGKKIEIKIAATGGDQAAAEFKKAEQGAQGLGAAGPGVDDLTKKLEELQKRAQALVEPMDNASESAGGLEGKVSDIARVQKAQAVAQLAGQVGQLGSRFRDAAEGVAELDPALAKTLENTGATLEKVSGGIATIATGFAVGGPIGAGVAGLSILAGELAGAWINAGKAASEMDAQTAAALESVVDRMSAVAAEKTKLELKNWLATLSEEEAAITAQNEALDRNRQLLEAAEAAKAKLASAQANKEIAAIDADTSLSEEEKIKRKAAVRENLERSKVDNALNKEGRDVAAAEQAAEAKKAEAARLAADAADVAKRKEETDKELKATELRERQRQNALMQLPKAQRDYELAQQTELIQGSNPLRSKQDKDRVRAEAEAAARTLEQLQNTAFADPKNAINAEALRKEKAATDAAAEKTKAAAEKAALEAEKLRLDADAKRKQFDINKGSAIETYQVDKETRDIGTNAAAAAARKRAEDKEKSEAEKKQREEAAEARRAEAAAARRLRDEAGVGRDAKGLLPKGVSDRFRNAVEAAAAGLQDGDQGGEVEKIAALMEVFANAVQGRSRAQDIKIDQLQAQIKELRNPAS